MAVEGEVEVERNDLGIGRIREELTTLAKLDVFIGVQGKEAAEPHPNAPDATVGEIAVWNHFGTDTIPERPWVDQAISNIGTGAEKATKKAISDLIDGRVRTAEDALVPLGEMGAEAAVDAIDTSSQWATPLSESTISRKGHDQPLLDTGTLRESQSYTIRKGGNILKDGKAE